MSNQQGQSQQTSGQSSSSGGNSNQITQNMQKKYTYLAPIKQLQDRLQDMYTNRADMVNATGDGWAATHNNELREIFWVYLKALGWVGGFHGNLLGVPLIILSGIIAGVMFEVGLYLLGISLLLIGALMYVGAIGYLIYAEKLTEESMKWAVGQNTGMFFKKMKTAMSFVTTNTWVITAVIFVGSLFFVGLFEKYMITFTAKMVKVFGIIVPDELAGPIYNNGLMFALSWFIIVTIAIYVFRARWIEDTIFLANKKRLENEKTQNIFKYKDAVQEVKALF